jgi:Xaa-Pro aminopeptidase
VTAGCGDALLAAAAETPSLTLTDTEPSLDLVGMRRDRLARVRRALEDAGADAALLFDPIQMRYATGFRAYATFQMHIPSNYLLVTVNGPVVMFAVDQVAPLAVALETIDEVRDPVPVTPFGAGARLDANIGRLARMVADALGPARRCLAVGRCHIALPAALERCGLTVVDADLPLERARSVKLPDEVRCLNVAIAVAETALHRVRAAVEPGVAEHDLTAVLHQVNVQHGGDWIETRLLASGDRINPWERESSGRRLRPGDLVAVDTDMVGPLGYCADISRTFHCGPGRPTAVQRALYSTAVEEVTHNAGLLEPGLPFAELTARLWARPQRLRERRYDMAVHGIGMSDEWPCIFQSEDAHASYEGVVEPGMVLAVESYVGEVDAPDGVKLEEMILVTEHGTRQLTRFPYEEELLG